MFVPIISSKANGENLKGFFINAHKSSYTVVSISFIDTGNAPSINKSFIITLSL